MNIFINVLRILHPMKNAVNFYKYLTNFIKCDMGWERIGTGHDKFIIISQFNPPENIQTGGQERSCPL